MPYSHTPVYVPVDAASKSMGSNSVVADSCSNSTTQESVFTPCYDPNNPILGGSTAFTNDNLSFANSTGGSWRLGPTNISLSSGKYYWEVIVDSLSSANIGVATFPPKLGSLTADLGADNFGWGYENGGNKKNGGSSSSYGNSYTTGDVVGIALDLDNKAIYFSKNGTFQASGDPTSGASKTNAAFTNSDNSFGDVAIAPIVGLHTAGTANIRFQDSAWSHPPPTGYSAITSTNIGIGNTAILNKVADFFDGGTPPGLSRGNLFLVPGSDDANVPATISFSSGKFYFEAQWHLTGGSGNISAVGFVEASTARIDNDNYYFEDSGNNPSMGIVMNDPGGTDNNVSVNASSQGTFDDCDNNDLFMFAIDADTGKFFVGKNGSWFNSGNPDGGSGQVATASGITNYLPLICQGGSGSNQGQLTMNFGATPFAFPPSTINASNYVSLNTANLAASSIPDPSAHFQTQTWTGNASTRSITFNGKSDMQPDMVWIRKRDSISNSALYDVIRGANKELRTTANDAEADVTSGGETGVTAFNSDGFTIGDRGEINGNTQTFVSWSWKAGGSASTVTNGMTQISDTSVNSNISRSVNTDAKFSIFTYTGTGNASKIQHGLGVTPEMFWIKCRDSTQGWHVWHKNLDTTNKGYTILNNGQKYETFTDFRIWGSNSFPDATHLMVGTHDGTNKLNDDYVGYAWAGVKGYSAFGTYEANNSTDNAFIHLGFRPSLFICKNIDTGTDGATQSDWLIFDSIRNPINDGSANFVKTNLTATESQFNLDFLASGVKIRADNISLGTAETFIYMAWAERPFDLNTRPNPVKIDFS
tara:strand:- start:653 stop:3106 length:2454 start_codon:yes stop_codon:yes gene_type:complete